MTWFLERNTDLLICEIRQAVADTDYEFEMAPSNGPTETLRFSNPTELINEYLGRLTALQAEGWRPRLSGSNISA